MVRNVTLSVAGSLDDSVALGALLDTDPDLRGHVRRAVAQVPEGVLSGGLPDLLIALGPAGLPPRWPVSSWCGCDSAAGRCRCTSRGLMARSSSSPPSVSVRSAATS